MVIRLGVNSLVRNGMAAPLIDENVIIDLVGRKVVSDTFRRLNPEKKGKLYETALRQFGKYGYDGLSIDQFCTQAKISKGSFFQYFPSKTHLLEFTLLSLDHRLETLIEEIKKEEAKALAKDRILNLLVILTCAEKLNENEKRFYHFAANAIYHSAVTVEGINISRHFTKYVAEIIERGIETKEFRADLATADTVSIVMLAIDSQLNSFFLLNTVPDQESLSDFVSILFDGIKS